MNERILSVGQLTGQIKQVVERGFSDIWVSGEIVGLKRHSSGHVYLTLKDDEARINAVVFRNRLRFLAMTPAEMRDGLQVVCHGRLDVYPPHGAYKLLIEQMRPDGKGTLLEKLEALKKKMEAEGLLDESRKRPLPVVPRCIGIVTSPTSAAIQDMLETIQQRYPSHIRIYPASVQGEGAVTDLVRGLEVLDADDLVDVIIIGRGGGAFEDLLPFSDEAVIRAISNCRTPVVSAVGHETDFPLCDLVADRRAPTPTGAAQLVVPLLVDLRGTLDKQRDLLNVTADRMMSRFEQRLGDVAAGLDSAAERQFHRLDGRIASMRQELTQRHPAHLLERAMQRGLRLGERLDSEMARVLENRSHRLRHLEARLSGLAPTGPLKRGYALVQTSSGKLVRSSKDVTPGDRVKVRLQEGGFDAEVREVEEDQ